MHKIKRVLKRNFIKFYGMINKIEKKIVFMCNDGESYSDNPRAISEKMHELYPDYKLVWGLNRVKDEYGIIPDYIEIVPTNSFLFMKHIATACSFIQNKAMSKSLYKRKKQCFIQTWHGDRGIKKILYDSRISKNMNIKDTDIADGKLTNLFIIGSDYAEKRSVSAFQYGGEFLKVGMPRNDKLIFPIDEEKIRQALLINSKTKILLYAPTLRKDCKVFKTTVDLQKTLEKLEEKGEDWVCLVRAHPRTLGVDYDNSEKIIDASSYPDMADLLMITDMLITDYSSCAGDFILRHKPVILAQFDLEQYNREERTFYVDINEIGYLIARSQEELNHIIETMDEDMYAKNCDKILDYYGTKETGKSAEHICRVIDNWYTSNIK